MPSPRQERQGTDMPSDRRLTITADGVEDALPHAEAVNRQFVESTGDCVKILDLEGRILYINQAGLRMLDLPDAAGLLNQPIASFFEGETRRAAESTVAAARRGGQGSFQYVMPTSTGAAKWWDAMVTPITDRDGTIVQLLAISRDITQRRNEEVFRFAQHQVLEMIATGGPLPAVLERVALMVEQQCDGMLCSI